MPTMTVQSATMRRLRRVLAARRMKGALAPAGGVAKKPSQPPLFLALTDTPSRRADGSSCPRQVTKVAESAEIRNSPTSFSKGAHVRVRTPVGTLRTGRPLLLWLSAIVVSAAEEQEDGCLGVVYTHYKNPRGDPVCTVRVNKKDVKRMPPPAASAATGSSDVTSWHSARCLSQDNKAAPPRPTAAGKKPSLLKKMEEEMRSKSEAILDSWR